MSGPNQVRNAVFALAAAIALLAVSLVVAGSLNGPSPESVANSQIELRDSLVWNCAHEGEPLRRVIRLILREDIRSSANVKPSFFPDIPPKVLHRLIKTQVAAKRRRLKLVKPVDCEQLYPAPAP